ncbi:MAG: hypothetical protein HOV76_13500 [Hamadaea sp.]|nr:hypothetical protein [Hamadaea sp.]
MLSLLRRRTTATLRGRRGRAAGPEWKARRRLLRNREDLTDTQFSTIWSQLIGTGDIGMTLLTAWIAKEKLRDLLARARTTDRHRTGHLRWMFLTWCADCDIPRSPYPRAHHRPMVARDPSVRCHRPRQRQEQRHQPHDQARRASRPRLPQPHQPTPTHTLRHHTPGPRPPPPRLNSKTPQTLPPEFVVRGPAARYAFGNRAGIRLYARTECAVVSRVLRLDA